MKMPPIPTNLPKMSLLKPSLYISEWFLLSEGSEAWVNEPRFLVTWHVFFFSSALTVVIEWVMPILFLATLVFRLFVVACFCFIIPTLALLAVAFYKHLLLTGRDLRFASGPLLADLGSSVCVSV
jgi:hypothetical protein